MANDTKKINDLVSESDDDTSELAALSEDALDGADVEFEADAATQAFGSLTGDAVADTDSIAALRSELHERDDNIERLEFELQQFRSRAKGLEKELEAREELTRNLANELEQHKKASADFREQLRTGEEQLGAVRSDLADRDARLVDMGRERDAAQASAESARAAYEDLQKRHAAGLEDAERLGSELTGERARRKWAEDAEQRLGKAINELEERQRESSEVIASLREYIDGRKSSWDRQASELETRERTLREQQQLIDRLTADAQQSTERLEKEASGRQQAERHLEDLQKELDGLRGKFAGLGDALAEKEAGIVALQSEAEELRKQAGQTSAALRQAEQKLSDALSDADREHAGMAALRDELAKVRAQAGERETLLAEREQAIERLESRSSRVEAELRDAQIARKELETRLAGEQDDRRKLHADHESLTSQADALRSELDTLRAAAAGYAEREEGYSKLAGQVTSLGDVIADLRTQLARTEGYADTLRDKLQREIADGEARSATNEQLAASLTEASSRLDQLSAELAEERQHKTRLIDQLEKGRKEFEEEVRRIRFELDEAQETIADGRHVTEQLTSDLVDSTEQRRTLEAKLSEFDETHRLRIKGLTDEVARLKLKLEDNERKLAHKDAALKALLAEFAGKPKPASRRAERSADRVAEEVVHRLPARKQAGDEGSPDRDRVTRLLVGTIDGQKLRFPLFKDKLTIGRTAHNDIQIKAQYISRRHAVVVTEDEQTRIVDWGSKNGVYVNGMRVTEKTLRNGDQVTVGTAEFVFEERPKR